MPQARDAVPLARRTGGSADLRQGNLTQILRYVRDHGSSSRHDIAHGCGLGISTMTDLIGELRLRRLVKELDPIRRPGAGRPTRPISLDGEPWCVFGVHVDFDRISFAAATVGGRELWSDSVAIDLKAAGAEASQATLDELLRTQVARIPTDKKLVAVEVGVPGYVARDRGTVSWSAALGWRDLPLGELIAKTLAGLGIEEIHVGISNDCHLAALHATRVELDLPPDAIAAYLGGSRRVGSAVIIDGEIFRGSNGGAGDFGHHNVDPDGPRCWCGRHGCLHSLVGPSRLLASAGLMPAAEAERLVDDHPDKAVQLLADAADAGDATVLAALAAASDVLGGAIDDIIGLINPDAVVLGGYLGVIGNHLLPAIEQRTALRRSITAFASTTVLALHQMLPRVVAGAMLAAGDAVLYDPLILTSQVET
jgi:predicted NBD/HSP70 family sugar kinase